MRVMVIVKASKESEAGQMPDEKISTEMGKFNEQLVKAGVMLAGDGLHPDIEGQAREVLGAPAGLWSTDRSRRPRSSSPGFWIPGGSKSMDEAVSPG